MPGSYYDPDSLTKRAELWRIEAATATLLEMRTFCLDEAERCEQRALKSRTTPVLSTPTLATPTHSTSALSTPRLPSARLSTGARYHRAG